MFRLDASNLNSCVFLIYTYIFHKSALSSVVGLVGLLTEKQKFETSIQILEQRQGGVFGLWFCFSLRIMSGWKENRGRYKVVDSA